MEIQRVNRIYATKDETAGCVYKVKADQPYKVNISKKNWQRGLTKEQQDQVINSSYLDVNTGTMYGYYYKDKIDKLANCPTHCLIDNEGILTIDQIDKDYYIELAKLRIKDYLGGKEEMATAKKTEKAVVAPQLVFEAVELTEEEKRTSNLFKKISLLQKYFDEVAPTFEEDGYNAGQKYTYVKAGQYKSALRKGCIQTGLAFKVNMTNVMPIQLAKDSSMTALVFQGTIQLIDIDTGVATAYYVSAVGADSLDKQASKAETLLIKDFIKGNFLISDNEPESDPEATPAPLTVKPATPKAPATPEVREEIKKEVVATTNASSVPLESVNHAVELLKAIRLASGNPTEGEKTMSKLLARDENGNPTIDKLDFRKVCNALEERADGLQVSR